MGGSPDHESIADLPSQSTCPFTAESGILLYDWLRELEI
jgi:hypothetical protein